MTEQVFMNFRVPKLELFIKLRSLFTLFYQILHIFLSKIAKNLMSGQNLPPKPHARARTSSPTFIRESLPPPPFPPRHGIRHKSSLPVKAYSEKYELSCQTCSLWADVYFESPQHSLGPFCGRESSLRNSFSFSLCFVRFLHKMESVQFIF